MSEEKPAQTDMIAMMDQLGTQLENLGNLMGAYYKSLRSNGIPPVLAAQMLIDYQRIILQAGKKPGQ